MMTRPTTQTGFTLIEVLVALAILAIALTSCLWFSARTTHQAIELQNRLIASLTARNELSEVQMGLIKLTPDKPVVGVSRNAGVRVHYSLRIRRVLSHADELSVTVGMQAGQALVEQKAFYFHNPSDKP